MKIKKIKVLIIATTKFELNGITNVILNYYWAMEKSDMQIDFVIPNDIGNDLRNELGLFGSNIYKISGRNKKPFTYISKLSKLINKNSYDIVHAHGNSCTLALEMIAAKKGKVKVRISHSHSSNCKYKIIHKVLRKLFNNNYTHAFACGQKSGEWLFKGNPFVIINNGINLEMYKYDEMIRKEYRNKYGLNGKKVVGHIGHFSYPKNQEYLVKIFHELYKLDNSYRLILIGDGQLRQNIQEQVANLGLTNTVIFTGKTSEVPQLMQALDIIVMPSRFEGFPLTLVEAQSACLPCFVSDTISSEVAITDLVQFISLNKSPKEWANQINTFTPKNRRESSNTIYNQIAEAGYSITENAEKIKRLYKSYLALRDG
jgi:glycosyltransferase involved in cell wall biosynthesis